MGILAELLVGMRPNSGLIQPTDGALTSSIKRVGPTRVAETLGKNPRKRRKLTVNGSFYPKKRLPNAVRNVLKSKGKDLAENPITAYRMRARFTGQSDGAV